MTKNLLCSSVQDFKIEINTSKINKLYHIIKQKFDAKALTIEYVPEYSSMMSYLSDYGAMAVTGSNLDIYVWSGTLLQLLLPQQFVDLAEKSKKAKLNFECFAYFEHFNEIETHFDGFLESKWDKQPFENKSKKICNLNYIVASVDPNAYTYVIDKKTGEKEIYWSIPGTASIMDPSEYHGVVNTGYREVIQMRWFSPIEDVKQFLAENNF